MVDLDTKGNSCLLEIQVLKLGSENTPGLEAFSASHALETLTVESLMSPCMTERI